MTLERTLVFIDAGYLSKLSKHFGGGKYLKLDIIKFAQYLSIKQNLWCAHIFYYTAPPFQDTTPTMKDAQMRAGYDKYMSKLKRNRDLTVREGRVQNIDGQFTQKGVDTLLTMDLAEEPSERGINTIILLACDTDFVPILNRIRERHKIKVILYYFMDRQRGSIFSMSNHILTACDVPALLTSEYFTRNLLCF